MPMLPAAAIAFLALGLLVAACGGVAAASKLAVIVTPGSTLSTQPFAVRVRGAAGGARVTLRLTGTDARGVRWSSSARFSADGSGRVDTASSAPTGGDYHGVQEMGLFAALHSPAAGATLAPFFWTHRAMPFTVTAQSSGRRASATLARSLFAAGVTCRQVTLAGEGFEGQFCAPPGTQRGPAILQIGGSEGGIGILDGPPIASAGYPILDIGYFKLPGLPQTLSDIPLEYFATALRWLDEQPDVNPAQVFVMGASRGSEAAELLGANYPALVHGVVSLSPSAIAFGSLPAGGPAWTLGGRPVPYSAAFSADSPVQDPAADIHVEAIHGPILFACGEKDEEWTSCAYAREMMQRLSAHHTRYRHVLYAYPKAGHLINILLPYQPLPLYVNPETGASDLAAANQAGVVSLWTRFLHFLPRAVD
ncbi:MAG: acyl-CoA thioesterase/bile acid-CoA:amino acid N-acyltransferase family protein [Candidatus Dormibacteraceae bacterium]